MKAVVTDIEGTITSISFVKDVLFPYARAELPGFVRENAGRPDIAALLEEVGGADLDRVIMTLVQWIDEDRKAPPLKALQGMMWARGYAEGHYRGHLYPDAVDAFRRWNEAGVPIYIYSSGSVEAQRLLFRYSEHGDLTPLVSGYFDTRTGAKADPASYRAIASAIGVPAGEITFYSDTPAELEAAASVGMTAVQVRRDSTSRNHFG